MNESAFRDRLRSLVSASGAVYFKVSGSALQRKGWPDLFLAARLWSGWLELKVGANKADPLQRAQIRSLQFQHVNAFVLRGITTKFAILEDADGNKIGSITLSDGPSLFQQLANLSANYIRAESSS